MASASSATTSCNDHVGVGEFIETDQSSGPLDEDTYAHCNDLVSCTYPGEIFLCKDFSAVVTFEGPFDPEDANAWIQSLVDGFCDGLEAGGFEVNRHNTDPCGNILVDPMHHNMEAMWFGQCEQNNAGQWHIHMAWRMPDSMPLKGKLVKAWKTRVGIDFYKKNMKSTNWNLEIRTNKRTHGWEPINMPQFVGRYLLRKKRVSHLNKGGDTFYTRGHSVTDAVLLQWQTEADEWYANGGISKELKRRAQPEDADTGPEAKLSSQAVLFLQGVDSMVNAGCMTLSHVRQRLPILYNNAMAKGRDKHLTTMLSHARIKLLDDTCLGTHLHDPDLMVLPEAMAPPENILTQLIELQGYDASYFCLVVNRWADLTLGKRGCLSFYGVASSGKSMFHDALKFCSPATGAVNKNNENFPFNDCVEKFLISWEEGEMTPKYVQTAKQIFQMSTCTIDKKGKESAEILPTPTVCATNCDLRRCEGGNTTSMAEYDALNERMTVYHFTKKVRFGRPPFDTQANQGSYPFETTQYPTRADLKKMIKACYMWGAQFRHIPLDKNTSEPQLSNGLGHTWVHQQCDSLHR